MEQEGLTYKVVMEPGTTIKGKFQYFGEWRCLQPCDEEENPVEGQRLRTLFIPTSMRMVDRSKYTPHQGKRECARRLRQQERVNHG